MVLHKEIRNNILFITINREEKYNALNRAFFSEMDECLDEIRDQDEIKGVILTGKGSKAFAAGADISEFASFDSNQGKKLSRDGHNVLNRIESNSKPFIAAINGFALGGGCELAMACHIRIASENASFGQPEVNLGLTPGYGGTQRLVQLVGKGRALELLLTADSIKADKALHYGLVTQVVSAEDLLSTAEAQMQKIISKAPIAISKVIDCVNSLYKDGIVGFTTEVNHFGECFDTEDFKEGTQAFIEKRKANFQNK